MQSMTPTLLVVALFVVAIALIPYGLKWLKQKTALGSLGAGDALRVVSAVAVGAHQRVVTVEAGPAHARVWLVLGVTPTAISCLHKAPLGDERQAQNAENSANNSNGERV